MVQGILVPPAAAVRDPKRWGEAWEELREKAQRKEDQIFLFCDVASPLNSKTFGARLLCCVSPLPRLTEVKAALRRVSALRQNPRVSPERDKEHNSTCRPRPDVAGGCRASSGPFIWSVKRFGDDTISVTDVHSGAALMQIKEPKYGVMVNSILHAPFRGFIDRQLELIPIEQPHDILALRESSLINTDYVWVGFADGTIRLFPADPRRVRERDRCVLLARGELADLVFELPKYHAGAIVAITRSPCHEDDKTDDLVMANRLSSSIRALTAAVPRGSLEGCEHLSLVCTASEDSCIVVWDLQKIYGRLEEMRHSSRRAMAEGHTFRSPGLELRGDVISFSLNALPGVPGCTVRSTCMMVKVRALFKLKGGVGGLRTLKWITTTVTTVGYLKSRDAVSMTRDPKESTAPQIIRSRHAWQHMTRWEKREEHRMMLHLREIEMQEVENELASLMPPLVPEPSQQKRINLIVAGDVHGTVHLWDLDEELERAPHEASPSFDSAMRTRSSSSASRRSDSLSNSFNFTPSPHREQRRNSLSQKTGNRMVQARSEGGFSTEHTHCGLFSPTCSSSALKRQQGQSSGINSTAREGYSPSNSFSGVFHGKQIAGGRHRAAGVTSFPPWLSSPKGSSAKTMSAASSLTKSRGEEESFSRFSMPSYVTHGELRPRENIDTLHGLESYGDSTKQVKRGINKPKATTPKWVSPMAKGVAETRSSTATLLNSENRLTRMNEGSSVKKSVRESRKNVRKVTDSSSIKKGGDGATATATLVAVTSDVSPFSSRRRVFTRTAQGTLKQTSAPGRNSMSEAIEATLVRKPKTRNTALALDDSWSMEWSSARAASSTPHHLRSVRSTDRLPSAMVFTDSARFSGKTLGSPKWVTDHHRSNAMYDRRAKCTMNLTDGGTITGIAVDLPPLIPVTMRRLPDPPEPYYSLLEQPTAEEMRYRKLANTFHELTSERALFHAFSKLEFYVSVEGSVMNMKCVPKLHRDGGAQWSPSHSIYTEGSNADSSLFSFRLCFQQKILERHSQPIMLLFVDHPRRQLWVARSDGLLSVLSTRTKGVITRVPHPSVEKALGPPNKAEWKKQQCEVLLAKWQRIRLEKHKECKKYPPGHFVDFAPISVLQEFRFIEVAATREMDLDSATHPALTEAKCATRDIAVIDDRKALGNHARGREVSLGRLLETLKLCRQNAVSVRKAQRDYYNSLHDVVATQMRQLITRCATLDALHRARKAFRAWMHHREQFPRHYVLRSLRRSRLMKLSQVSRVILMNASRRLRAIYFTNWLSATCNRQSYRMKGQLSHSLGVHRHTNRIVGMVTFLVDHARRRHYWLLWRSAVAPPPRVSTPSPISRKVSPEGGRGTRQMYTPRTPRSARVMRSVSRPRGPGRDEIFLKFYAILWQVDDFRQQLICFRWNEEAESVLDVDSLWLETIETAAQEAETQATHASKLAVFKFGLLPILEGLLSTAEEVLPYMREMTVSNEVKSLIQGCLMCVDYMYADAASLVNTLADNGDCSAYGNHAQAKYFDLVGNERLQRTREMRALFDDAMDEHEFQSQIEAIVAQHSIIDEFVRVCCST